eukprot:scaffold55595_cov60-Phaeocystis_antarctica.AAC.3
MVRGVVTHGKGCTTPSGVYRSMPEVEVRLALHELEPASRLVVRQVVQLDLLPAPPPRHLKPYGELAPRRRRARRARRVGRAHQLLQREQVRAGERGGRCRACVRARVRRQHRGARHCHADHRRALHSSSTAAVAAAAVTAVAAATDRIGWGRGFEEDRRRDPKSLARTYAEQLAERGGVAQPEALVELELACGRWRGARPRRRVAVARRQGILGHLDGGARLCRRQQRRGCLFAEGARAAPAAPRPLRRRGGPQVAVRGQRPRRCIGRTTAVRRSTTAEGRSTTAVRHRARHRGPRWTKRPRHQRRQRRHGPASAGHRGLASAGRGRARPAQAGPARSWLSRPRWVGSARSGPWRRRRVRRACGSGVAPPRGRRSSTRRARRMRAWRTRPRGSRTAARGQSAACCHRRSASQAGDSAAAAARAAAAAERAMAAAAAARVRAAVVAAARATAAVTARVAWVAWAEERRTAAHRTAAHAT